MLTDIKPLADGILEDSQRLLRQELALAKAEMRQEFKAAKDVSIRAGIGLALASLALLLGALTLVHLLEWAVPTLPQWADYAIVTVGLGLPAAGLLLSARTMAEHRLFPWTTKPALGGAS